MPAPGYVFIGGEMIECLGDCASCNPADITECYECLGGYYLEEGACQ